MPTYQFVFDGEMRTIVAASWREDPDADGWVVFWERWRNPQTGATERPVGRYPIEDPRRISNGSDSAASQAPAPPGRGGRLWALQARHTRGHP
jgi:hypothetical protein